MRPCLKIEKDRQGHPNPSMDFAFVYSVHTGRHVYTPHPYTHESRKSRFWNCFELLYEVSALGGGSFRITETEVFCTELKGLAVKSSIFKNRDTQKGCRTAASVCRGNQDWVNTWSLTRQGRSQRRGWFCSHLLSQWLTSFPALSMFSGNPISHLPWIIKSWLLKNLA